MKVKNGRVNEHFACAINNKELTASALIMPVFVKEGSGLRNPVESMPGVYQYSIDRLPEEIKYIRDAGVSSVLLFGIPAKKDEEGTAAYDGDGVVQQAIREIKRQAPELMVITDICLCEYTSHGHCGAIVKEGGSFSIDKERTRGLLAEMALSHARAGADMVAPSAMLEGQVGAIRERLDREGLGDFSIMGYSAKYASSFYGPFRDAAESAPKFGDRSSYQMDPRLSDEALEEARLDIEEGADIVMVKPALGYQDVIYRIKERFRHPLACYCVSGEYAMVKAAARNGWLDEKKVVIEMMRGFKRAGADIIITYWAKDIARWLKA